MKNQGADFKFIFHGLLVDDIMHVPAFEKLSDESLKPYQKDF